MKLAILLQCHKNSKQINMLIQTLKHPDIDIYVHVDQKSNIKDDIMKNEQVFILPDELRVDVQWGKFSQVEASLNLMEYASRKKAYDFYWICSGQDFPIKKVDEIVRFFETHSQNCFRFWESKNFQGIENNLDKRNTIYYPLWVLGNQMPRRILKRLWIELTGGYYKTFKLFRRRYSYKLQSYFGSSWFAVTQETWLWMKTYLENHPQMIQYYKNCNCPDESFFHTLVMASPYAHQMTDYLHYIDFPKGSNSPRILQSEDYGDMIASKYLMARKFDLNSQPDVIKKLAAYCTCSDD